MIVWSILAAQKSQLFQEIVVSTDDEEIAHVAEQYGAIAPFRRPTELANDHAPTLPVIAHSIRWWEERRGPIETACCIYATAPFLQPSDLRRGFEKLQEHRDADFVFSVTTYAFPIFRSLRRDSSGQVEMFWPENELVRSQDLEEAWHDAGQFYWGRREAFINRTGVFSANSYGIELPRQRVQDIDTEEDWERAERIFAVGGLPEA